MIKTHFEDKFAAVTAATRTTKGILDPSVVGYASMPDGTCKTCGYTEHASGCSTLGPACPRAREAGLPHGWEAIDHARDGMNGRPGSFVRCFESGGYAAVALLSRGGDFKVAERKERANHAWQWSEDVRGSMLGTVPPGDAAGVARAVDAILNK